MPLSLLTDRARTWLHREDMDECLAAGQSPAASAAMTLRAQRLCSSHVREFLAQGVDAALSAAEASPLHTPSENDTLRTSVQMAIDALD